MANIMHWLVPKEKKFFEMLTEQSENALECIKELKIFVDNYHKLERSERKANTQPIKNIGKKGDEITHRILEKLDRNFITPIDREDIYKMAVILEDIINLTNAVALRFVVLGVERVDDHITKLMGIVYNQITEVNKRIAYLKKLKGMNEHDAKIRSLGDELEDAYHEALSDLFHFYKNPIDIMKYREIYELLKGISDKCGDMANVTESVMIKHT